MLDAPRQLTVTSSADRGSDEPTQRKVERTICKGLGYLSYPIMRPLSGFAYDPSAWSENDDQCAATSTLFLMSLATLGVSQAAPNGSPVFGAGSFDRFFRDALRSRSKHSNLFSEPGGEIYTPILGTLLVFGASALSDGAPGYRDSVSRAFPLLWLGVGGHNLLTESAKKAFGRKRPFLKYNNQGAIQAYGINDDARESFFSGHAGTAFFAASFTDRVLADIIQSKHEEYCLTCDTSWQGWSERFAQGFVLYGLATYVGYSRIEIDKHFMTDVLMGGAVGGLAGQLTYWTGYKGYSFKGGVVEPVAIPGGMALSWRF